MAMNDLRLYFLISLSLIVYYNVCKNFKGSLVSSVPVFDRFLQKPLGSPVNPVQKLVKKFEK